MNQLSVTNPRNGIQDYNVPVIDREVVAEKARRLRSAQPLWARDSERRVAVLESWADALDQHSSALAQALEKDTGRRLLSVLEARSMIDRIRYWTGRLPSLISENQGVVPTEAANVTAHQQLVPYSLVGIISPWNFPLTLALVDAIPALCAGCAVLLKPSEVAPRFAEVLDRSLADVPELREIFAVITGDASTGKAIVDNVDMLCFTGSVATGREVAVQAAQNFIPVCLELGGKDPAVVLEDADLDAAADAILRSAAGSCGQACMSIERIYVHETQASDFMQRLSKRAADQTFNQPDISRGTLPPFIDQRQAQKVAAQLEEAVHKGAKILCGGPPQQLDGGYWMAPTILTKASHDMSVMREETFGPILPIMTFLNDDEAISLANDSDYGLSGSVFGEESHAIAVAQQLDVGAVGINDASMTALIFDVEKQSFKSSGMGPSRMGDSSLLRFYRRKALLVQNGTPAPLAVLDEAGLANFGQR